MASPLIVSLKKQKRFSGSKVRILSPAKINLYLNIIGKYPDGFHRLESIVERISLKDEIEVTVKTDFGIKLSSNCKSLETKNNLVVKAAQLIKKRYRIPYGLDIRLKKNIPVGSGLGGGSSNAASTVLALNSLFDLGLNKVQLYRLGQALGSDVNFFLSQSRFAYISGRGEKVRPLAINSKFKHFIIWPGKSISTKAVYARAKPKLTKFFNSAKILQNALERKDTALIKKSIFNALEENACSICPELRKAKRYLTERNIFAKVTGSGSALYTTDTPLALKVLKNSLSSSWKVFATETF
ncbi:MAG: 4-(cytidine 5'-diphospho)-2-C-methyl-D-erythritol kinase [Candidatus Omnitrophica bacterium]|nr:4-(cytidine 5'-diphospho)-2-C-methyl-D-erythritol kinase [Candidatus Omnitrophota bacterium]MBU2251233.1 4-(cytidine 5'-diphospho)-2-C-methyl-D-erythritol kinase [Candidatus Omnitrophota bacterium]MBU2265695.1 4-(cytidine 5'-diphospho)-2-C-methyl-D-erythritol kinase [Candidatus Omnitrophota bacterium]